MGTHEKQDEEHDSFSALARLRHLDHHHYRFRPERILWIYLFPILMRDFLKRLTLSATMALMALLILELPVQWNYEHQITDAGDWHRLDSINAEVLIIGNSRVESGFDATKIEAQTGLKTYCLVQTGWQSRLLRKKLENYLQVNRPPRFLVIQSDPLHLGTRSDWYAKPIFLKFLFLDRENLYETMKAYKGFHWYEFYIPFVRYIGLLGRYIRDALNIPYPLHRVKGYRPNNGRNRNEPIPFDELSMTQEDIDYLSEFYKQCPKANHIALFPLVTPALYPRINGVDNLSQFCIENQVEFINLNEIIIAKPDSIFSNHTHVNSWGAAQQSNELIHALQQH